MQWTHTLSDIYQIHLDLKVFGNSPFRLTSSIYAEKFEFENPAIMELSFTERVSVIANETGFFFR